MRNARVEDRRKNRRFAIRLPVRYRLSRRGAESQWRTGITHDMSKGGLVFGSRRPLPVGSHVELQIDWPASAECVCRVNLQVTGFVMRSGRGRTAVRIGAHHFVMNPESGALPKTV